MKVNDLLPDEHQLKEELIPIKDRCSMFIQESQGIPVLKNLPTTHKDFQKIKIRVKEDTTTFNDTFNEAFENEKHSLRQRAIFANGEISFEPADGMLEPFYIFPIDGYRFMYCTEVENSSNEYKSTFDTMLEQFGEKEGKSLITEVLKFSYTSENLREGIEVGAEIIFYGIPFYYAVRESAVDDYENLLTTIREIE